MGEAVVVKNAIEKRKGQFVYLKENTKLNQKEIAAKLGVAPATVNSYNKQYKEGILDVAPIEVNLETKKVKGNSGHDPELANLRKAMFVYLIENTNLLQKDMAEVIGVSKAAIGKYNTAYKLGKYSDIEPVQPEGLEKYLTAEELEKLNSETVEEITTPIEESSTEESSTEEGSTEDGSTEENILAEQEVAATVAEEPTDLEEEKRVEKELELNWVDDETIKQDYMKAAVVETTLESASTDDISTILELFTKQLNTQNLYDLKITIRKK